MLGKIKLKEGDTVLSVNGQPVHSHKKLYQKISSIIKTKNKFSLKLRRGQESFLISYTRSPKRKKRVFVSQIKKIKHKSLKKRISDRRLASKKTASVQKAKVSPIPSSQKKSAGKKYLVPKKYKPHLQKAYVSALNSFVYEAPDFDSKKLFPLLVGRHVLISKKVFRPDHNFGSFYKILIFRKKKIVGYISTAEVIPEFIKKGPRYKPHSAYKLAKKQMAQGGLDIELMDKLQRHQQKEKKPQDLKEGKSSHTRRYIGPSVSFFTPSFYFLDQRKIHLGLKLSGYNTLISYLNMDLNLSGSINLQHFYFDVLFAYPLLRSSYYHFLAMGGVYTDLNMGRGNDQVDYGFPMALSLVIPIYNKFLFRLGFKAQYGLRKGSFLYGPLCALQVGF